MPTRQNARTVGELVELASNGLDDTMVMEVETNEDVEEFSLDTIPGVTPVIAANLQARGVQSLQDLVELGSANLMQMKGIGPSRADAILTYARNTLATQDEKK
jgi:ERCC4-type nuclease